MNATDYILSGIVALTFGFSWLKSREKSRKALGVTKNVFINQAPIFIAIFLLIGIFEAFLTKEIIEKFLGNSGSILSTLGGTAIGGVAAGPPAAAYPIAKYLWSSGASHAAVASFVVAWISVGTVTLPMEIATFGKRFALIRWTFSITAAAIIGVIMGVLV